MASRQYQIAKAGWMHRLSSVLKRWKKGWFVLYDNGDLKYFDSPNSHTAEECIVMRAECTQVVQGKEVDCSLAPPEGRKKEHLLRLNLRTGFMVLCAEDADDMRTWQLLLDDARTLRPPQMSQPSHVNMGAPPPYPGQPMAPHPGQPMAPHPGQPMAPYQNVIYAPPAYPPQSPYTTTVINQGVYPRQHSSYSYPGQVLYGTNPGYIQPNTTTVIYADQHQYRRRRGINGNMGTGFVAGAALGTMMWSPMMFW